MELIKGKTYSAHNSIIKVKILQIYHVSDKGYTKAKIQLLNSGAIVETKTYKLVHSRISHWREE